MNDFGKRGFTLLELMIVVAIISILMAISVPNIARSRAQAREAQVIGFLRQYHIAQIQFQAAGIKDSNGDGIGDFGTLQDLLDANIYAYDDSANDAPAPGGAAPYLDAVREFMLPRAYAAAARPQPAGSLPTQASDRAVERAGDRPQKPPRDSKPDNDTPGSSGDDRAGGKPETDTKPSETGSSGGGSTNAGDVGGGAGGRGADTDGGSGGGSTNAGDAGGGVGGRGADTDGGSGGGSTNAGDAGGGAGGRGGGQSDSGGGGGGSQGSGPAFLEGVSPSLLRDGMLYGYRFQFTTSVQSDQDPGWYEVTCRPANPAAGGRGFYIDASGVIRQAVDGSFPNEASKQL